MGPGRFLIGLQEDGVRRPRRRRRRRPSGAASGVWSTWTARGVSAPAGATVAAGDAVGAIGLAAPVPVHAVAAGRAAAAAFLASCSATNAAACACLPTGFAAGSRLGAGRGGLVRRRGGATGFCSGLRSGLRAGFSSEVLAHGQHAMDRAAPTSAAPAGSSAPRATRSRRPGTWPRCGMRARSSSATTSARC